MNQMVRIPTVFADGGCILKNPSDIGGTWAYCYVNALGVRTANGSGVIPANGHPITNNYAEMIAVLNALEGLPPGWSGLVCSDSAVTLGRLFDGWPWRGIPREIQGRSVLALRRLGRLYPLRLDGHPTQQQLLTGVGRKGGPVSSHQVWCDEAARAAGVAYLARLEKRTNGV